MTKPEKKALVPVLRFPEFQNEPEWQETKLGKVAENLDFKRVPITEADRVKGVIPYYGASGVIDYIEDYIFDEDLLCISEDGANLIARTYPIAFSISGKTWVNNHAHVLKFKHHFTQIIVENYLNVKNLENFLTGMAQPKLNQTKLDIVPIPLPDEDEQQKIADCLSSLDDLITAQTQKLAALKAHKKGLMQQLFPAEGETVPKLRFPEFRDGGEWLEICLKELCERIMDGTHFSPKTKDGSRMYLTSKNIQDGKINLSNISYISEEEHNVIYEKCPVKLNDVLLTKDGANTGNCALNTIDSEFSLLSSVAVLRGNASLIDQGFLYQMILSDKTQRIIKESMSGQAITRITLDKIGNFTISITDLKEQQKIADCLSSIDELITAQSQKIEALKSHKKGLMQQLFPRMDEDNHPPPAAYPSRGGELRDEPFPSSGGVDSEAGRGGSPPTTGRGD